jgi:signal peptidase I
VDLGVAIGAALAAGRYVPPEYAQLGRLLLLAFAIGVVCVGAYVIKMVISDEFDEARRRRMALKEGRLLANEAARIVRRHGYRVSESIVRELKGHAEALRAAVRAHEFEALRAEMTTVDELIDKHLDFGRKSTLREYAESIGVAVLIALLLRSFVVEAFKIPSGSMIPTLKVGDHIFVNKFIYGLGWPLSGVKFWRYGKPHRGDVIVFKYPEEPDKDFIKRVVAIEGDTVEIRDGRVLLNGQVLPREHVGVLTYTDISDEVSPPRVESRVADEWRETIDGKPFSIYTNVGASASVCSWGCGKPIKVPEGKVFVMGDNRDNSHDSRYWGFVPDEFIKGKALFIWYSGDPTRPFPTGVRLDRLGHLVE